MDARVKQTIQHKRLRRGRAPVGAAAEPRGKQDLVRGAGGLDRDAAGPASKTRKPTQRRSSRRIKPRPWRMRRLG